MDKISIIVPIYNVEKYLEKCIYSIINQTYKNLEIILVDDGSTDNCYRICDDFQKKDKRVIVLHKKNGGLSDARNAGLQLATGELIGFVDGDDYIRNDMYEQMYKCMKNKKVDIVECKCINVRNEKEEEVNDSSKTYLYDGKAALKLMMSSKKKIQKPRLSVWSKLFKREVIERLKFPVGKVHEDIVFEAKAFLNAKKVCILDKQLYCYNIREGSIMNSGFSKKDLDKLILMQERTELLKQRKLNDLVEVSEINYYETVLRYYYLASINKTINIKQKLEELLKKDKYRILNLRLSEVRKVEFKIFYFSPQIYIIWNNIKYRLRGE